jgi:hypothetical protein
MKLAPPLARAASVFALALLASCTSPPPPPPLPVAVVPPAAPPPPPVALPRGLIEQAAAYRAYVNRAAGLSAAFANGPAVQQSLTSAATLEPKQFLRGAIAYGALVALQSPQFVASVRTYAVNPAGRRELADRLRADPHYAAALPSAASAAGPVSTALASDAARIRQVGELVKQAAYDVQRQPWSKTDVAGRDARLANAKLVSAQPMSAPAADVEMLTTAVNGRDASGVSALSVVGDALPPPYTAVVSRALTVAALAALGEATAPESEAAWARLLDENSAAFCLNLSKLNLYQCLSVAKPHYEDVFCLGQHILLDTAQCVNKAAGTPPTATIAVASPPAAPSASAPAVK